MTSDEMSAGAGIVVSLIFAYVPGFRQWYAALDPDRKRVVMLAALAAVAVGVFVLGCANLSGAVACSQAGGIGLVRAFIAAAIANQATYLLAPKQAE